MDRIEWEEKYFSETDREKRARLLASGEGIQNESEEYRELLVRLFKNRYIREKEKDVDVALRGWMTLSFLQTTSMGKLSKGRAEKEKNKILEQLGWKIASEYGPAGKRIWYEEMKNLTRLYIELSETDKHYSSIIWGFGRRKEGSLSRKIADDIFSVACAGPSKLRSQEDFAMLSLAAKEVFYKKYPSAREYLDKKIENYR